MLPKNRPPTTPGEMLVEEFLEPAGITQAAFAERIGMSPQQLNPILRGKHAVSARVALKFSQALGTSPEFWMNLQTRVDLWNEQRRRGFVGKIASFFSGTSRTKMTARDVTGPLPKTVSAQRPRLEASGSTLRSKTKRAAAKRVLKRSAERRPGDVAVAKKA
jgi:addiction module HigA family antidote